MGKGACHRAQQPEFNPWYRHGEQRECTLQNCPLTSDHVTWPSWMSHCRRLPGGSVVLSLGGQLKVYRVCLSELRGSFVSGGGGQRYCTKHYNSWNTGYVLVSAFFMGTPVAHGLSQGHGVRESLPSATLSLSWPQMTSGCLPSCVSPLATP